MQRDATPREPFHVGHWRTVIDGRAMLRLLLQYREYSGRRRMSRPASAHAGSADENAVAIHVPSLLSDADDHDQGTGSHGIRYPHKLAFFEAIDGGVDSNGDPRSPERHGAGLRRSLRRHAHNTQYETEPMIHSRHGRPATPAGHESELCAANRVFARLPAPA